MTTTEPGRDQVVRGLLDEQAAFAALIAPLTEDEWRAPTCCEGWEVRDIAAHVTANAVDSADGTIGSRSADEQARALRGHSPDEMAELLRTGSARLQPLLAVLDDAAWSSPSPVPDRTLGNGVLTIWYDTYVHDVDVRTALGRPAESGPGLTASVSWLAAELTRMERGPLTLDLDGLPQHRVGDGGPRVTGDPLRFVLAATGRTDPAALGLDQDVNVYAPR